MAVYHVPQVKVEFELCHPLYNENSILDKCPVVHSSVEVNVAMVSKKQCARIVQAS